MSEPPTRRGLGLGLCAAFASAVARRAVARGFEDIEPALAAIEARCGGRLGVGILDTATGRPHGRRLGERFPLCSTHKVLSAAAALRRVDRGEDRLDRDVGDGTTLAMACEAAIVSSDNTAANLLFAALGGPAGVTAFLRGIGDPATRLDRTEPALNEARPGDLRDTTTPAAMAATLGRLICGDALLPASRARLAGWMVACRTGDARLRAGVPADWRAGDKTGTGDHGTANDVGVFHPPERPPLVLAVFLTGSPATPAERNAALAAVARAVADRA